MKSSSALMTVWFQVGKQRRRKRGWTFCSMDAMVVVLIRRCRYYALLALTDLNRAILQTRHAGAINTDTALTSVA